MIRRALLSISHKTGIAEFARGLRKRSVDIIATEGTAEVLRAAGVSVQTMEEVTRFPGCFSGRVKSMHPLIMGGILFERGNAQHEAQARALSIEPIDLVVVNLYPFVETVERGASDAEVIGNIDVGGCVLLRAAAKNHAHITAICDPADYDRVLMQIGKRGDTTPELRRELAEKAFTLTARYDAAIVEHFSEGRSKGIFLSDGRALRYGENPHQRGAFFRIPPGFQCIHALKTEGRQGASEPWTGDVPFHMYQGRELSYLNILDADAAWALVHEFAEPTAVFVKHANPSGVASNDTIEDAFQCAYDADRLSAFGVIIALNQPCNAEIAERIIDQKIFTEVLVAPRYEDAALEILRKKPNVRVLRACADRESRRANREALRSAFGGVLVQNEDDRVVTENDLTHVTGKKPTEEQVRNLLFAWKVVKHARSNAIVFAKDRVTVGIGTGQTSRVEAVWIAAKRAGDKTKGAVMASDAFFPFPDSVEEAARHGIAAIIQPGGSIRDEEVFAKAEELGLAMVTTGVRAFRH